MWDQVCQNRFRWSKQYILDVPRPGSQWQRACLPIHNAHACGRLQEAQSLAPPLRPRLRHPLDARNFPHFDSPRHAAGARRGAGARGGGAQGGGPCAEEWEGWDWVSSGRPTSANRLHRRTNV